MQEHISYALSRQMMPNLGIAAARVLKQGTTERRLVNAEALGNTRKIPDRLDGNLGDGKITMLVQADLSIGHTEGDSESAAGRRCARAR